MVHELNNPLTSISVYAEFLVDRSSAAWRPISIGQEGRRGRGADPQLTRDLISYARPSGEWRAAAINDVVRQALVFCEHVLHRAEAVVRVELSDEVPVLRAITTQLHQVLINLVTNACHALPEAGQRIW